MPRSALIGGGQTLVGFILGHALARRSLAEVRAIYADLGEQVLKGALSVPVKKVYPIEEIKAAFDARAAGRSSSRRMARYRRSSRRHGGSAPGPDALADDVALVVGVGSHLGLPATDVRGLVPRGGHRQVGPLRLLGRQVARLARGLGPVPHDVDGSRRVWLAPAPGTARALPRPPPARERPAAVRGGL